MKGQVRQFAEMMCWIGYIGFLVKNDRDLRARLIHEGKISREKRLLGPDYHHRPTFVMNPTEGGRVREFLLKICWEHQHQAQHIAWLKMEEWVHKDYVDSSFS